MVSILSWNGKSTTYSVALDMNSMLPVTAASAKAHQVKGSRSLDTWTTVRRLEVRLSRRRSTMVMVPTTRW